MCFIKMCTQQRYQMIGSQPGGASASSHLPSQGYQFERKIKAVKELCAYIWLTFFYLPKLARGASSTMLIPMSRALGLYPSSEERHISIGYTEFT